MNILNLFLLVFWGLSVFIADMKGYLSMLSLIQLTTMLNIFCMSGALAIDTPGFSSSSLVVLASAVSSWGLVLGLALSRSNVIGVKAFWRKYFKDFIQLTVGSIERSFFKIHFTNVIMIVMLVSLLLIGLPGISKNPELFKMKQSSGFGLIYSRLTLIVSPILIMIAAIVDSRNGGFKGFAKIVLPLSILGFLGGFKGAAVGTLIEYFSIASISTQCLAPKITKRNLFPIRSLIVILGIGALAIVVLYFSTRMSLGISGFGEFLRFLYFRLYEDKLMAIQAFVQGLSDSNNAFSFSLYDASFRSIESIASKIASVFNPQVSNVENINQMLAKAMGATVDTLQYQTMGWDLPYAIMGVSGIYLLELLRGASQGLLIGSLIRLTSRNIGMNAATFSAVVSWSVIATPLLKGFWGSNVIFKSIDYMINCLVIFTIIGIAIRIARFPRSSI